MLEGRKACSLHLQHRSPRRLAHRRHRHPQTGRTVALEEDVRGCVGEKTTLNLLLLLLGSLGPSTVTCNKHLNQYVKETKFGFSI